MANKHTPKPWRIMKDSYGVERIWGPDGDDVACAIGDGSLPDEEQAANALLIAAAPDLLEACENIEQFGASRYEDLGIGRMVRAAIAKAKGTA